jgi:hypothetical protein
MNPRVFPVNVPQPHLHDVACSQAQASEQKKYRSVSLADRRGPVARIYEALYVI